MRLEVLITKYLDGELTSGEDRELRQLLSQNPEAKNTFDLSISLHHALRKDAGQIAPPSQLVRETEDRILMAILNQPEPQSEKKKEKRFFSLFSTGSRVLTGLVAVLLPVFTSTIGFETMPFVRQSANRLAGISSSAQQHNTGPELPSYRVHRSQPEGRFQSHTGRRQNNSIPNSRSVAGAIASSEHPVVPVVIEGQFTDDTNNKAEQSNGLLVGRNQDLNSSGDIPLAAAITAGPSGYPARLSTISASLSVLGFSGSPFGGIAFGDRVHLSTTFGHDVLDVASGDPLGLSFVSQSLAYSLGESENAGIEVGYHWFTYGKVTSKFIANTSSPNEWDDNSDPYGYDSKPQAMRLQGSDEEPKEPNDKEMSLPPDKPADGEYITSVEAYPKRTWWGAAFYERTFTHNERISLQGRIGAGGSNDGALAYIRATGLYRVLDNLSVSVGVDARGMMLRTQYISPKSSTVKTSLSIIYGVQFHL